MAAIINLSSVYKSSGRNLLAVQLLSKTLKSEKLSTAEKAKMLNNLGANQLVLGSLIEAKISFEKALDLIKNEKNQTEILSNSYQNLAQIYSQEQNFVLANSYFEKAKKIYFTDSNRNLRSDAKLYLEEANLLFLQKKFKIASGKIKTIFEILIPNYKTQNTLLPTTNMLYAETVLLDALDLQAAIYEAENNPKKALETYQLSFHIDDLLSNLSGYENSKILNQISIRNRVEKCINIYNSLNTINKQNNYVETAFKLCEKTKSSVLKNYLSNKKTTTVDEKLLQEKFQNLSSEILREQQKQNYADISKLNKLVKKQNEIMLLLKNTNAKNPVISEQILDMKLLYSKLNKDKTTLITYFSGSQKTYSFTIYNNKISLQSFDNNLKNKTFIHTFLEYFRSPDAITSDVSGYNNTGKTVYDLLQLPKKNTSKKLLIIPDGILNFVPFEALITKKSNSSNFEKMHYLLQDFTIGYNNSVSFYLNSKPISKNNKKVLGIFPVFENTDYELTFSKKEMQSIQKDFEGKYFENNAASFDNFKKNAAYYSILHLSTHGFSGDTQVPASIKFYDKEILYSELYNLKINPDLVVLSACETGIGKLYKSEGAMSVARGFQFAGAQNLLFSLWKVNDYTTAVFMADFYKNLKNGNSFIDANHKAKLDFLGNNNIPNAKKSPYYWSAFVYYGTLENENSFSNYWIFTALIFGLIVLFFIWKKHSNSKTKKQF